MTLVICLGAKCSSAASLESILFNSLNKSSLTKDEERRLTCSAGVKEVSGTNITRGKKLCPLVVCLFLKPSIVTITFVVWRPVYKLVK